MKTITVLLFLATVAFINCLDTADEREAGDDKTDECNKCDCEEGVPKCDGEECNPQERKKRASDECEAGHVKTDECNNKCVCEEGVFKCDGEACNSQEKRDSDECEAGHVKTDECNNKCVCEEGVFKCDGEKCTPQERKKREPILRTLANGPVKEQRRRRLYSRPAKAMRSYIGQYM